MITAVPARHRPVDWEPATGEMTGFALSGETLPTVYVSGDNAPLDLIGEIVQRVGEVDTAVIFAGAARTPFFDRAVGTLDAAQAAQTVRLLGARPAVVAHTDSWGHLTENGGAAEKAFAAGAPGDRGCAGTKDVVCTPVRCWSSC